MLAHALLALFTLFAPTAGTEVDVVSKDGQWVARIRKAPGQEQVDDRLARWQLSVHETVTGAELWSCSFPHSQVEGRRLLSDDGSTFALVTSAFSDPRPVIHAYRFGSHVGEIPGRELGLARGDLHVTRTGSTWLAAAEDEARFEWRESNAGDWLGLVLIADGRWQRTVDLSMCEVFEPAGPEQGPLNPTVLPEVNPDFREFVRTPYVTGLRVPRHMLHGLPVEVVVVGSYPTPNWTLGGFEYEWEGEALDHLVLLPLSLPPAVHVPTPQVIEGFDGRAYVNGLGAGHYTVSARGLEDVPIAGRPLEVLPARLRIRLRTTGGFAGVDDSVEVFAPGVVAVERSFERRDEPRREHVAPDGLDRIDALLPALPREVRPRKRVGADYFHHELGWWAGDAWVVVELEDDTAPAPMRELIEILRAL